MYVHHLNLMQKENHKTKYRDDKSKIYLKNILEQYNIWRSENDNIKGPFITPKEDDNDILRKRVQLFSRYKDFIDQQIYAEKFDSRSNLHSSVLEEFMYILFKDMVESISENALIGKASTYKDLFFSHKSYRDMLENVGAKIEEKDHDFVIGVNINADMYPLGQIDKKEYKFRIPAIAIECKTYLDKTMLEGSSNAAAQLKSGNPNALYIVVMEWIKLTENVNLKKYQVDQIYVLRKQKNTDREFRYLESYNKNPVYDEVIILLFDMSHLSCFKN